MEVKRTNGAANTAEAAALARLMAETRAVLIQEAAAYCASLADESVAERSVVDRAYGRTVQAETEAAATQNDLQRMSPEVREMREAGQSLD